MRARAGAAPRSGRHPRCPRRLLLLPLAFVVLFLGDAAHATRRFNQEDPAGPPPLPTPDAQFLSTVFSADAQMELPHDVDAQEVADFQWKRLLDLSHPAPFLVCATNGRRGYRQMLRGFNRIDVLPVFANKTMSCTVIHAPASALVDATASMPQVTMGTPVPSVLKIAKELWGRVDSGAFFDAPAPSLRVVLGPGTELQPGGLVNILRRFVRALRSGQYVQAVETDFEWSTVGNSTAQRRLHRRLARQERELMHLATEEDVDDDHHHTDDDRINGANYWAGHIVPVLGGDLRCNFSNVVATIQNPYLRLGGFFDLVTSHDEEVGAGEHYSNSTRPAASACLMSLLAFVSSDPSVLYLEEYPELELHNAAAAHITQSGDGAPGTLPFFDVGLDGTGQVVQVSDTGLDQQSCFFSDSAGPVASTTLTAAAFDLTKRKVVQYVVWGDDGDIPNGHGTHVVGTLVGACNDPQFNMVDYNGIARGAKVAFYDLTNSGIGGGGLTVPSNLNLRLFPPAYKAGARLFSNSWGTSDLRVTYLDTEVDKFMFNNDEALIFFSAGNGASKGLGTVYSPGLSKNALTVSASENERFSGYNRNYVAYFSSLGPTSDGRIKPDVVAPGRVLASALAAEKGKASCETTIKQGTSMAVPVVSGSAAIVRQYFEQGWYPSGVKTAGDGFRPTGALVKAALINSAVPMQAFKFLNGTLLPLGLPPDAYQGHGRIKLDKVLKVRNIPTTVPNLWVADRVSLAEGQRHWYKFSFPGDVAVRNQSFQLTLVWIDPDTTASSAAVVLHDLDLLVLRQSSSTPLHPNRLLGPDSRNTVEKVVIYDPQPGDTLTVTIAGTSIATQPTQQYALVASGNFVGGAWYCQHPKATRANDAYTTENCYAACERYPKKPVCCAATAGTVCSAQEAAEAAADGLTCDAATMPTECLGQWYCQFPRLGRLNDFYTTQNCAAECDGGGNTRNPLCCAATAEAVCSVEEAAAAAADGIACDAATQPVECPTPPPTLPPTKVRSSFAVPCFHPPVPFP